MAKFTPTYVGQIEGTAAGKPMPDTDITAEGTPAPNMGLTAESEVSAAGSPMPESPIKPIKINTEGSGCLSILLNPWKFFRGGKER